MVSDKEFNDVLGVITGHWNQKNFEEALKGIDELAAHATSDQKAQCLLFKGMIRKDQGQLIEARSEWLQAIPISRPGSFLRASLEYEVGSLFEMENQPEEALGYYRSAIETCAFGDDFAGDATAASLFGY